MAESKAKSFDFAAFSDALIELHDEQILISTNDDAWP